jgi:hypothetical protein
VVIPGHKVFAAAKQERRKADWAHGLSDLLPGDRDNTFLCQIFQPGSFVRSRVLDIKSTKSNGRWETSMQTIDITIMLTNGKAYFFGGSECARYNVAEGACWIATS